MTDTTQKTPLEEHMHREMVRMLVMKQIFCPRNNTVLDVRTCVVFVDSDGDPRAVMSQSGYAELEPEQIETLKGMGIVVDEATVKPAEK